ncbi:GPI anchored serine-threonine rich family protein [Streptomyces spororaveus]|uniref:GPI anchored serine-threonine rich family protein n=1 Tax=Streptomyces spororaveus TaxID=284039 RepID=UPI0037B3AAB3
METLATARRRPHLVLAAAVLALAYSAITGVTQPQPAAAAAKFAQPISNVVREAGKTYSIVWTDGPPGTQSLRLMKGQATALQQVAQIAAVDGASGTYAWTVPADLPTDNTYAIALGTQFTITGHESGALSSVGERLPAPAPVPATPTPTRARPPHTPNRYCRPSRPGPLEVADRILAYAAGGEGAVAWSWGPLPSTSNLVRDWSGRADRGASPARCCLTEAVWTAGQRKLGNAPSPARHCTFTSQRDGPNGDCPAGIPTARP